MPLNNLRQQIIAQIYRHIESFLLRVLTSSAFLKAIMFFFMILNAHYISSTNLLPVPYP